jgi:hypothetical protein
MAFMTMLDEQRPNLVFKELELFGRNRRFIAMRRDARPSHRHHAQNHNLPKLVLVHVATQIVGG